VLKPATHLVRRRLPDVLDFDVVVAATLALAGRAERRGDQLCPARGFRLLLLASVALDLAVLGPLGALLGFCGSSVGASGVDDRGNRDRRRDDRKREGSDRKPVSPPERGEDHRLA
jgi:hypothetical protein